MSTMRDSRRTLDQATRVVFSFVPNLPEKFKNFFTTVKKKFYNGVEWCVSVPFRVRKCSILYKSSKKCEKCENLLVLQKEASADLEKGKQENFQSNSLMSFIKCCLVYGPVRRNESPSARFRRLRRSLRVRQVRGQRVQRGQQVRRGQRVRRSQ